MTNEAAPNELRILVFGQSDATGEHLADREQAWPNLVAARLEEQHGRPVTVIVRPTYLHVAGVERYIGKELERQRPDIVIFTASTFAFAQRMVVVSVRRRFGDRPANAYNWLERRVDSRTRQSVVGSRANRIARRVLTKLLGAEPVATYEMVIEGTGLALARMAEEEQLTTVVYQSNPLNAAERSPLILAQLHQFDADLQAIARRLRLPYIDGRPALLADADQSTMLFPDRLHYTTRAHSILAETALAAFDDGRIPLPE